MSLALSRRALLALATLPLLTPLRAGAGEVIVTDRPGEVPWASLPPGAEVVIRAGRYDMPLVIPARGTADRPILIRAETPGSARFTQPIHLDGARHTILRDVTMTGTEHSAIVLQQGAEAVTVEGCLLQDTALGIWIGNGAGAGHRLIGNRLERCRTMGIAIDALNAAPGRETWIQRNEILDTGIHGMEIHGSHYIVTHNAVRRSGQRSAGCSGIHTFCRAPEDDHGKNNVIAFNICSDTREVEAQDGNGIQADQWCDDNLIAFNICYGNDGAGINLYDASRTVVVNNTVVGNMRDPGRTHAYPAEITLSSDYTRRMARPSGNRIESNICVATRRETTALWVEATAGSMPQRIGNNLVYNTAGGEAFFWAPRRWRGSSAEVWAGFTGGIDRVADPRFYDIDQPGQEGFRLRPDSPARGLAVKDAALSLLDVTPTALGAVQA